MNKMVRENIVIKLERGGGGGGGGGNRATRGGGGGGGGGMREHGDQMGWERVRKLV